jgi:hypothetical protein
MLRYSLSLIVLLIAATSSSMDAQSFSAPYEVSSHGAFASPIEFNFDVADTTLFDPTMIHRLVYRDASATSWNLANMLLLYQTCTTYTFSTPVSFAPPSGTMEYYFRSEIDSAVVSQSPKNAANTFPVPSYLMADMGSDPTGDAVGAAGPYLDLTGCQLSYSDTKLYGRLTNVSGGYPTNSGLTAFFLYAVGFVNPDATDSSAYALVYVNVPFVMTAGLYKLNATDTSFAKIGNISTNITGNALSMSCNISDLTAQPGWPTWPPSSGFVLTTAMTATQTTSGLQTSDQGKTGVYIPTSKVFVCTTPNNAPALQSAQVTPSFPNRVSASISYHDPDSNLATIRDLHFGATTYPLQACEKNYGDWAEFDGKLTVTTSGWYPYYFRFSDGVDTATTPLDSVFVTVALAGDADGNGMVNISDVTFLILYIFGGGAAPNPLESGDANCDGMINISDAVYLVTYIFGGGSAPCLPE